MHLSTEQVWVYLFLKVQNFQFNLTKLNFNILRITTYLHWKSINFSHATMKNF